MMPPPKVVPARHAPKTIAARPPAKASPAQFDAATDPLEQMFETPAGRLLHEVSMKETTPPSTTRTGRGARPNRPSQVRRETGRSFERMTDRLLQAQEAELAAKAENAELKSELARRSTEVKELTQANDELKAANTQLQGWNQHWQQENARMVASLPDAGQWKMMYEAAERGRAELQASMQTMQKDRRESMVKMSEEIKSGEEARRRELTRDKVEQLKAKDRELTQLREELLQKEVELEAVAKSAPEAGIEPELYYGRLGTIHSQ